MSLAKLTVIVLAVNETSSLERIIKTIKDFDYFIEKIIIVSPKSVTNECKKTQLQLKKKYKKIETLIQDHKLPGYGGAIKFSMKFINSEYFIWIDGDGETDPKYLEEMYRIITSDNSIDIVSASRFKRHNIFIKDYGFLDSILTYSFQLLCRILFDSKITDYTVAYRIYRTSMFKKYNFISNSQNFSLESLLPFVNNKVKIFEIYYLWTKRIEGTSRNNIFNKLSYFKIIFKYLLLKIKIKLLK